MMVINAFQEKCQVAYLNYLTSIFAQLYEGSTMIISDLQVRKLRLSKVR